MTNPMSQLPPELAAILNGGGQQAAPPPPAPMMPDQGMAPPGMPEDGVAPADPDMFYGDDRPGPDEVSYDWGQCCSTCAHFTAPADCALIDVHARPDGVCELYELNAELPEDPVFGDV